MATEVRETQTSRAFLAGLFLGLGVAVLTLKLLTVSHYVFVFCWDRTQHQWQQCAGFPVGDRNGQ